MSAGFIVLLILGCFYILGCLTGFNIAWYYWVSLQGEKQDTKQKYVSVFLYTHIHLHSTPRVSNIRPTGQNQSPEAISPLRYN